LSAHKVEVGFVPEVPVVVVKGSETPPIPPPLSENPAPPNPLKCPDCEMVAKSKLGLSSHLRFKHKK
jgi:hypothetical protein